MFYGGLSLFWVAVFAIAIIYLNNKINRVSARLDKTAGKDKEPARVPDLAEPPSLAQMASSFAAPAAPAEYKMPSSQGAASSDHRINTEEKGGQWLGKIGILAIILGVSFFLRWAFVNDYIGETGRVIIGIIGGIAFVAVGQFLRKKYLVYSDIVSGGGIAILYLTIFAAFAYYHIIQSSAVAFSLMFLITALSVTLSVLGGTQQLAVLGIAGGFLTPLLISVPGNNFGELMGYLVILDLGILGVAIFKKWTRLNLLGFIGTVIWSGIWFGRFYTHAQLSQVFLVLTIFFIIYLIAGIVHNVLWKKESKGEDFFLITFNAAFYALASYVILNPEYHAVMGFFMFFLAVFYFLMAFIAFRMNPEDKTLNLYLPGIAIVFLTLAMPIQFSGKWITLAWLAEAALLTAAGSVVRRHSMNLFGIGVFAVGLVRFFAFDVNVRDILAYTPIFNSRFFLAAAAIAVAYYMGYTFAQHLGNGDDKGRKEGAVALFIVANLLSLFIVTIEINTHYQRSLFTMQNRLGELRNEFYKNGGPELSERGQAEFRAQENASNFEQRSIQNRRNTVVSIMWALYATVLTAIGFGAKRRLLRLFGLILFFVTALKVLIDVWALGEVYRIISSISFGVIALLVSFAYAKWKHRLHEVL